MGFFFCVPAFLRNPPSYSIFGKFIITEIGDNSCRNQTRINAKMVDTRELESNPQTEEEERTQKNMLYGFWAFIVVGLVVSTLFIANEVHVDQLEQRQQRQTYCVISGGGHTIGERLNCWWFCPSTVDVVFNDEISNWIGKLMGEGKGEHSSKSDKLDEIEAFDPIAEFNSNTKDGALDKEEIREIRRIIEELRQNDEKKKHGAEEGEKFRRYLLCVLGFLIVLLVGYVCVGAACIYFFEEKIKSMKK